MPDIHLVLYNDNRQIDSWDINPKWDALEVAEFTNGLRNRHQRADSV